MRRITIITTRKMCPDGRVRFLQLSFLAQLVPHHPHADGKVNPEHRVHNDLINELVAHNITPIVTLYHYDLPVWVDELGGWKSRDTVERFEHYCRVCFENFGDRVKYWLSLNEQNMQICYGNWLGVSKAVRLFKDQ